MSRWAVAVAAMLALLATGCTDRSSPATSTSSTSPASPSSRGVSGGDRSDSPVAVSGVSTTPTVADKGAVMDFAQIAQGEYPSLLGTWAEIAYGGSGLGGPGFQWHQGGTDTMSVTTTEIVNGSIVLRGKTLSDGQGVKDAEVVYGSNGRYLTASLADQSVGINYAVDFYPRSVPITNYSLNNGVTVPSSMDRIVVWSSNNTYTEVFSRSNPLHKSRR
jgi:hypothetical protein